MAYNARDVETEMAIMEKLSKFPVRRTNGKTMPKIKRSMTVVSGWIWTWWIRRSAATGGHAPRS